MNILALPAFADNYIWMLQDGVGAAVVDPGDPVPVLAALEAYGLQLRAILVTHHHPDHIGGVDALRDVLDGAVWGPASENIPKPFVPLHDGDTVDVLGLSLRVLFVPGHTAGHIAYYAQPDDAPPILFCGDTLFSAGCGRVFEGTPAQLHDSLMRLAALPRDTRVYCTHEYTLGNLRFAQAVEPANPAIAQAVSRVTELRAAGGVSLPSTLADELRINPFLRCDVPDVVRSAEAHGAGDNSPVAVFTALRQWKNGFR